MLLAAILFKTKNKFLCCLKEEEVNVILDLSANE